MEEISRFRSYTFQISFASIRQNNDGIGERKQMIENRASWIEFMIWIMCHSPHFKVSLVVTI